MTDTIEISIYQIPEERARFVVQGHDDVYECDTIEQALIIIEKELLWREEHIREA